MVPELSNFPYQLTGERPPSTLPFSTLCKLDCCSLPLHLLFSMTYMIQHLHRDRTVVGVAEVGTEAITEAAAATATTQAMPGQGLSNAALTAMM